MPTPRFRRYPNLPGSPVSVTSVLAAAFPSPALDAWKIAEAVRLGREFPDESPHGILDRHRGAGMTNGTALHKAIETHLTFSPGQTRPGPVRQMYAHWQRWWNERRLVPIAVERTVHGLGYAGTPDLLALDDPEPGNVDPVVLVDWKSCTRLPAAPYPDHAAQLAAYADAVTEPVEYGIVVYVSTEGVREFVVADEDWTRAREAWDAAFALARAVWPEEFVQEAWT